MNKIEIKSTITIATIKLIGLQLFFAAVYLGTSLISDSVDQFNNGAFLNIITYDSLSFIIIALVQLMITLYIFLEWATDSYILFPEKIEHHQGIIFRKTDSWIIHNVGTAHLSQGLIARLFNYGTIRLHSPTLENRIILKNIPSPSLVVTAIEKNLTLLGKPEIHLMAPDTI